MSYIEGGDTPKAKRSEGDDAALIAKFNKWDAALDAHWSEWREEARTCYAMVAGHQVDDKIKEAAEESGVAYVVINEIDGIVSAVCGAEIQGRQEVRYFPREMTEHDPETGEPMDAKVNEILTGAAEWARDECDAGEEESQAFRDCVICGLGWTETRMDYEEDPEGMPKIERIDPLEMGIDPASRRSNAADARYLRRKKRFPRDEAAERFGIDVTTLPNASNPEPGGVHENNPGEAYQSGGTGDAPLRKDEIEVDEYQWFESVRAYAVLNPQTGQVETLEQAEFDKIGGKSLPHQRITKRRYRRAFRISTQMLEVENLPDDEFVYKCLTGKQDRNQGVWYGLVRAMVDPQRLKNKMASQVQRIIDHNAKGGLLAETGAFEDHRQAEEEWAGSDTIVWAKDGAIAKGAVIPKPVAPYPAAIDRMLMLVSEAIFAVSGINKEMLGLQQGTDQAGILDTQRKQASYAVLASFFDSLRRYRKQSGRLLLKLIAKYMSDGRLIRITGRQGNVRYAQLAKQADTLKYDVIVDEAPAGPNQKERTMAFLMSPFGAEVAKQAPPAMQLKFLEYTPLPTSLVSEMQELAAKMPEQKDPALVKAETDAQIKQMGMQADQQASQAQLQLAQQEAGAKLQLSQQESAASLQQKREQAMLDAQIKQEAAQRDADLAQAKAETEARLAMWKAQQEFALARQRAEWERELAHEQMESQHEIGMKKASMNGASAGLSKNREGGSLSE